MTRARKKCWEKRKPQASECSRLFLSVLLLNGARLKLFYLFYDIAFLRFVENRLYLPNILGYRKRSKYKLSQRALRWRHHKIKNSDWFKTQKLSSERLKRKTA